ncbi:MAG: 1,4-alpha-glucan branching protein GlgB [Deltaproteobacteria bacterium]|nr:1,4-alpha-glucan branching protein GlgB [Deltaproteobacteria bacterium]
MASTGEKKASNFSLLSADDLFLFNEGRHFRLYEKLGCHLVEAGGRKGGYFAVWAPDAETVSVIGDFNGWDGGAHPLRPRESSGIWEGFIPDVSRGACYKYRVRSRLNGHVADKADPFGLYHEVPPKTASIVWDTAYEWGDGPWLGARRMKNGHRAPMSIYEVHLGSWKRTQDDRALTYRELAEELVPYVVDTGFTHVEFLPVTEHPFYGSWGYQTTGYFAPTSRYGTPQDFMFLVDRFHRAGVGVILDWVPSHFPADAHGLGFFDGTHLYEHADRRQGHHPDWDSLIFNYGRNEVRSFLVSSAFFWLDRYHADGLRVDAVASMLYLDYGRREGEWIPNKHGGRENLEAVAFLRTLNEEVYRVFPDVQTIAEESTSWPMVSRPAYLGGLGFGMKWDMGWMHDTLDYMSRDPVHRRYHHDRLTFRMLYAFHENFVLPLSHDEVVYGKGSLLRKMPGDPWQKFANLRLLLGNLYAQPGKKLLFMGGEFGQWNEWTHEGGLDWDLLEDLMHQGVQHWVRDLNRILRQEPALHERDFEPAGFEWIDCNDSQQSVLCFLRKGEASQDAVVVVCNFTPVPHHGYRVGVPAKGRWRELLNSDAPLYGGSGQGNLGGVMAEEIPHHGRPYSLPLTLPPLAILFLARDESGQGRAAAAAPIPGEAGGRRVPSGASG